MRYLGMLILTLMCTFGCTPVKDDLSTSAKIGRAHYRRNCVQCHNYDPKLQGPVGPKLWEVPRERLIDRLKNGYRGMPKLPNSLRNVDRICEYLECK